MACGGGGSAKKSRSAEIERALRKDFAGYRSELKLLLLGTGESGKSTILKQMRIIHAAGFEEKEREGFKCLVYRNILRSTKALLDALESHKVDLRDQSLLDHAYVLLDTPEDSYNSIAPADAAFYARFWADPATQKMYERRNEFQLSDSTPYFFEHLARVTAAAYVPTDQDILRARQPTTGIHEIVLVLDKAVFRVLDVGGQRSERRKWIHCFENITSVIFIVASSEFDQQLVEEANVNRMAESISLFEQIINYYWFRETSFILFLNKVDLLQQKVTQTRTSIASFFPDFASSPARDAHNIEHVKTFILDMYLARKPPSHDVYPHWTLATDTEQTRKVFEAVKSTILRLHLKDYNLF